MKQALFWSCFMAWTLPVVSSALDPHVVGTLVVRNTDLETRKFLEERIPPINLGTYPLTFSLPYNYQLFSISERIGTTINSYNDSISITAKCVSCYFKGTAVVTTTGVKKDQSLIGDLIALSKDPLGTILNALDLELEVQLENLGGHFEIDVAFEISGIYTVPVWKTETPVGIQLDDANKVGILFSIELVIAVTGQLDFTMGFDLTFPKGASFILNPLTGHIVSMNVGGAQVTPIPPTFKSGSACVDVVVRLKFSAGVSVEELGYGLDWEAGVYLDPIQYKACITYEPSAPCEVEYTEYFYEEIAAYARAVEKIDYTKWGATPTAVATFVNVTLPSACLKTSSKKTIPHSTTAPKVTPPTVTKDRSTSTPPPIPHSTPPPPSVTHPKLSTVTSSTVKHSSTAPHTSSVSKPATSVHNSSPPLGSSKESSTNSHRSSSPASKSSIPHETVSQTGPYNDSSTGTHKSKSETSSSSKSSASIVYHQISISSSTAAPKFRNHTITSSTSSSLANPEESASVTDIAKSTIDIQVSSTDINTTPTNIIPNTSDWSNSINTDSIASTTALSTTDSTSLTDSPPSLINTDLITVTISTTSIYTITSCLAYMHICPSSLASEIILTKTIIQYTTVCPATQTDFPSSLAPSSPEAPSVAASSSSPNTNTPIELTTCDTPIISIVETEIASSVTGISIAVYSPTRHATVLSTHTSGSISTIVPVTILAQLPSSAAPPPPSSSVSISITVTVSPVPASTSQTISSSSSSTNSSPYSSASKSPGLAGVIYSLGGFSNPISTQLSTPSPGLSLSYIAASTAPEIKDQASPTSNTPPTQSSSNSSPNGQPLGTSIQGSGGVSNFRTTIWVAVLGTVVCGLWIIVG